MNLPHSGPFPFYRRHRILPMSRVTSPVLLLLSIHLLLLFISPATAYTELPDEFLSSLPSDDGDLDWDVGRLLAPILIPRVPGTDGQVRTQEHLVNFFRDELPEWDISWYNSTSTTPATGDRQLPFANLLFRREPPATQDRPGSAAYLTLVAHYDSKITPDGFIGATDSAAPCAMLLHVARTVEEHLVRTWGEENSEGAAQRQRQPRDDGDNLLVEGDVGIQILLLDGEEAFVSWTDTDSLYGARALAEEWDNTVNPAMSIYRNPLGQISMFVLLDLLGSANPSVPSYFQTTHWAYRALARVEARMRDLGLLESAPKQPFLPQADKKASQFRPAGVGDDHVPFMRRGVPILHLIPSPFPRVWHRMEDDGEHLDPPTVRDWARIVTAFALEWLDVTAPPPSPSPSSSPLGSGDGDVGTDGGAG